MLASWKKSYGQPRQHIKKQRHHFDNKGLYSQSYDFSNSHIRMWELDHKESWMMKNWCFLNCGAGEDSWECLGQQRSNQSILKGISPEYSLEGLMLKLKLQSFSHLIQRANSLERPWCWERLRAGEGGTEDEMVGWHHWLDGRVEQVLGDSEGQGGLVC